MTDNQVSGIETRSIIGSPNNIRGED